MRAEHRLGSSLLALLVVLAAAAPLVTAWEPGEQLDPVSARNRPPGTVVHLVRLADGGTRIADRLRGTGDGSIEIERLGVTETFAAADLDPEAPTERRRFALGSDHLGRDVWTRLVYGARVSLGVGALAALVAMLLGLAVGGVAGLAGGALDALLMRAVDALLAFPRLFLVIALAALLDPGIWVVVVVLGTTGWMRGARLVRAEVLSLAERDFVLAARAVGQSPARVLSRHLLPNALTPLIVDTALAVGDIILVEASLSYVGLGVRPPAPSWGNMIADGATALTSAWWVSLFPGLAILAAVVAVNLLGDALRDRLDPARGRC